MATSKNWFESTVSLLESGKVYTGFTDYFSNMLDTWTLAKTITSLVEANASGIFHVGSREPFSRYELIHELARQLQLPTHNIVPTSVSDNTNELRSKFNWLNTEKLEDFLNIQPPTICECVSSAINDLRHQR